MKYTVLIERDSDGFYVADVPELPGCHTQARSMNDLTKRIREAIKAYLGATGARRASQRQTTEFLGVQLVEA